MTGLYALFMTTYNNAAALKAALTGGLHKWDEVPQGTMPPYGRFEVYANEVKQTGGDVDIEFPRVQFSLFSDSPTGIDSVYLLFVAAFKGFRGTSGGKTYTMERTGGRTYQTAKGEYQASIPYKATITPT